MWFGDPFSHLFSLYIRKVSVCPTVLYYIQAISYGFIVAPPSFHWVAGLHCSNSTPVVFVMFIPFSCGVEDCLFWCRNQLGPLLSISPVSRMRSLQLYNWSRNRRNGICSGFCLLLLQCLHKLSFMRLNNSWSESEMYLLGVTTVYGTLVWHCFTPAMENWSTLCWWVGYG